MIYSYDKQSQLEDYLSLMASLDVGFSRVQFEKLFSEFTGNNWLFLWIVIELILIIFDLNQQFLAWTSLR